MRDFKHDGWKSDAVGWRLRFIGGKSNVAGWHLTPECRHLRFVGWLLESECRHSIAVFPAEFCLSQMLVDII
jgi:hypothetical protein